MRLIVIHLEHGHLDKAPATFRSQNGRKLAYHDMDGVDGVKYRFRNGLDVSLMPLIFDLHC